MTAPHQYDLALIAQVLDNTSTPKPDEIRAQCPVCATGSSGSGPLSIRLSTTGKPIYHCHAQQCDWRTISDAVNNRLGLEPWVANVQRKQGERTGAAMPMAEYEYGADAPDGLVGQTKKVYRAWKEGAKKVWGKGPNTGLHMLFWREGTYHQSSESGLVVVCEGEKAAAFLSRTGVETACWCGGTASADKCDVSRLDGKKVLIWADCDPPGLKAARTIKRRLLAADARRQVRIYAPVGEWGADAGDYDNARAHLARVIAGEQFTPQGELLPDKFVLFPKLSTEFEDFIHANRLIGWRLRFNLRNRAYEATQAPSPTPSDWEPIPKADGWLAIQQRDLARLIIRLEESDKGQDEFTPLYYKDVQMKKKLAGSMELRRRDGGSDDVAEWLKELPEWDGIERIRSFLSDHFGAEATELNQWASAALFVQVIKRTLEVPCRWRGIPILIGPQFTGKSALVQHLLPEHLQRYVVLELNLKEQSKSMVEQFMGCAVVELSEMAGMNRAGLEKVKSFITLPYDRQRLPYRTDAETVDRRCAFVGTMNQGSELPHDPSGSTRWVCVECPGGCDVESLFADSAYRQQLFAEAKLLASTPAFAKGIDRQLLEAQDEANMEHTESNELYDQAAELARDLGYTMKKLLELAEDAGLVERNPDGTKREFTHRQQKEFINSLRKVGYQRKRFYNKEFKGKYWILPE